MNTADTTPWVHGGADALGVPRFDFSTNSNACGPCAQALAAVQQADPGHYPDPHYTALREGLAAFHGVAVQRVLLAGSASEFIFRVSAWVARQGGGVWLPAHHYGDYARAAQAWGLPRVAEPGQAALVWACEPSSPLGQGHADWSPWLAVPPASGAEPVLVLDGAYAPLRLSGAPSLSEQQRQRVWQLFTPNKALGLTGVRAAYVIAPEGAQDAVAALQLLAPSWPLGAHGVAMLQAWLQPSVQEWLRDSLDTLRGWKSRQIALLSELGWTCLPSEANYFCARPAPPLGLDAGDAAAWWTAELARLRGQGIKLRDTASFGLPGQARLGVLPPAAQDALRATWLNRAALDRHFAQGANLYPGK